MKEHIITEWNHFVGRINYKKSALDARAIRFLNEFPKMLDELYKCKLNVEGFNERLERLNKQGILVLLHDNKEFTVKRLK